MKLEKNKKRERSESPKPKKPKRRYRNDRSKRRNISPDDSEESVKDSNLSHDEDVSSHDEKRKSSRKSKRSKKKKKRSNSSSDESRSPSPQPKEKHKKSKKKSSRHQSDNSNSEKEDDVNQKTRRSITPKKKKKKRHSSESVSPSPDRKKTNRRKKRAESNSPKVRRSRSKSLSDDNVKSRSVSPAARKKSSKTQANRKKPKDRSTSRSLSPVKTSHKRRSRSTSRSKRRRRKDSDSSSQDASKSPAKKEKSRSRTRSPKKKRDKSSPHRRKKRSRSPARKKRSSSRSPLRRKSRSRSPLRLKRSRTRSPTNRRRSFSISPLRKRKNSRSPSRRVRKSLSRSPSRRRKSRSRSPRRRKSRSRSPPRRRKSRSRSPSRRKRSRSKSPRRRKKGSKSPSRNRKSRSRSKSCCDQSKSPKRKPKKTSSLDKKTKSKSPIPEKQSEGETVTTKTVTNKEGDLKHVANETVSDDKMPIGEIEQSPKNLQTSDQIVVTEKMEKNESREINDAEVDVQETNPQVINNSIKKENEKDEQDVGMSIDHQTSNINLPKSDSHLDSKNQKDLTVKRDNEETVPNKKFTLENNVQKISNSNLEAIPTTGNEEKLIPASGDNFKSGDSVISDVNSTSFLQNLSPTLSVGDSIIKKEPDEEIKALKTSKPIEKIKTEPSVIPEINLKERTSKEDLKQADTEKVDVSKNVSKEIPKIFEARKGKIPAADTSVKPEKVSVKIVRVVKAVKPKPIENNIKSETSTSLQKKVSSDASEKKHRKTEKSKDSLSSNDTKSRESRRKDEARSSKRQKSPEKKKIPDAEEEMKKRRERIEQWRKERDKLKSSKTADNAKKDKESVWSLENDDEDYNDNKASGKTKSENRKPDLVSKKEEEEEEVDPLDAYMNSISKEIGAPTSLTDKKKGDDKKVKTFTVVKTVVKKSENDVKAKPEVMEQNQDALEYSSEEETQGDVTASDFADAVKKKKELAVADHSKIYYAPFRRNFYVEVPELARMSSDEVKLFREELGDIQVRGKNVPKPIKSWAQAGLSSKVMNVLKKCNYAKPTPIQAQAIPAVMSGRDMIGIAKTGSGKTLAFVLPMLRHVLDQPELEESDGPIAIIMTPTRELALQIYRECRKFCKPLQLSVACIYGGSGISEQIAELKKGAEIIVCTPGRMIDMLAANNGKVTNCRRCTYLVLDEADRMFDMGFEPQVMRIIDNIRPDRQTVLFSATFPRQMEAVARKVLQKPVEIQVGGRSIVCSDVEQHALVIDADNKFLKLLELLGVYHEKGSILVFVEKQETADVVFKDLLKKGYPCLSLHGGMDQFDRDSTIADFKNGVMTIMVSTSVAARGLDVKNLVLVVNYDCPNHYEDYVHRVGRTGRAGNKGTAFTFLTYEQGRNAGDIVKAFELSKRDPPSDVLALWNGYKEQMEKEGKKVKVNSGFSGKGFKFNADEAAQVNDAKKMQKFALGLQDSDDEAEAAESAIDKIEADLEKAFSNKPKIALAPEVKEAHESQVKAMGVSIDKGKLKQVSDIAALLNRKLSSGQITDRNTTATANILQGVQLESLKGVGLAKHLADKVNAKLNYKAIEPEKEKEEEKPNNVRYEEEIDLNDFPQQARWRITSKEIIEQVRELSEAGITVRGIYIPPNKKPEEGEKRLHLYIESLSERSIQIAKAEIKRLLKEELIRAESNSYRSNHQTGRYKVV